MKGLLAGAIAIVILALVLPRADEPDEPSGAAKRARAAVISSSGSIEHANSRDGMPIFTASNVGPGALVEGDVTIANTGSATGFFSLSQANLTDAPGPNGGALSQALELEIEDVTGTSQPKAIYRGPFAALGARPLGFIGAGGRRDYRFTAMLPDTGGPASSVSGDNALKGSSTSARFVWTAVQGGAPPGPGRPATPPPRRDLRPPRLRVSIPRVQRLLTRRYVNTRVRCSERCALTVRGRARGSRVFALRPQRRKLKAGRGATVRVNLSRRALRSLRGRLLDGKPIALRLTFVATDGARNRATVKRIVRLRPRRGAG